MSAPVTPIDQAMAELDSIWAESREIRREQIKNLREVCNNPEMKISPYDKAMMIQSKLAIINTIDSLLKSDENNSLQKAKMYLARKDSETNGQVGSTIIELLKMVRVNEKNNNIGGASVDSTAVTDELTAKVKELAEKGTDEDRQAVTISDGELQACDGGPSTEGTAESAAKAAAKADKDDGEED